MQAGEAVREPRDAVRLAAARGVLHQVVPAGPLEACALHDAVNGVELVVAREDHRLSPHRPRSLSVGHLLLAPLDEDVVAEDVEEAFPLEDLAPEVAAAVAGVVRRVALAALHVAGVVAAVEREEARLLALQLRRHVDLVRVRGEVDERALLEAEDRSPRVAVLAVLPAGVPPALSRPRVLQLAGGDRHAVQREQQVDRVTLAGVATDLPRDGQLVAREQLEGFRVEAARRFEVGEAEGLAVKLEAVPQDVQRALEVQLLRQRVHEHRVEVRAVERCHLRPGLGLCVLEEGGDARRAQRPLHVPFAEVAREPAAVEQHRLDGRLERPLLGLGRHRRLPRGSRLLYRFLHVNLASDGGRDKGRPVFPQAFDG